HGFHFRGRIAVGGAAWSVICNRLFSMLRVRNATVKDRRHGSLDKTVSSGVSTISGLRDYARRYVDTYGWLHVSVLVIGVVTVMAVRGAIFIAAGNSPGPIYTAGEIPSVQSARFATSLSSLVNAPLDQGGAVTILNNGDDFMPALLAAIDRAKKTVNFSVYIWRDGRFSAQVLDALVKA